MPTPILAMQSSMETMPGLREARYSMKVPPLTCGTLLSLRMMLRRQMVLWAALRMELLEIAFSGRILFQDVIREIVLRKLLRAIQRQILRLRMVMSERIFMLVTRNSLMKVILLAIICI